MSKKVGKHVKNVNVVFWIHLAAPTNNTLAPQKNTMYADLGPYVLRYSQCMCKRGRSLGRRCGAATLCRLQTRLRFDALTPPEDPQTLQTLRRFDAPTGPMTLQTLRRLDALTLQTLGWSETVTLQTLWRCPGDNMFHAFGLRQDLVT